MTIAPNALPERVQALLDGRDLEDKLGETVQLAVADGSVPRIALLSVGELLVTTPRSLFATLHAGSRTTRALREHGSAVLVVAHDGGVVKIEVEAGAVRTDDRSTVFRLAVATVEHDRASYGRVEHGFGFTLTVDPAPVLARWRAQIDVMRELAA